MNKELLELGIVKELINRNSPFLSTIKTTYDDIKDVLNSRIQKVFSNYTLHNADHSLRIIKYMGVIVKDISKLTDLELTILVLSALLHDIGMAVGDDQITKIKNDELTFDGLKFSAMLKIVDGNEDLALQEYVRRVHSQLSKIYIDKNLKQHFTIPEMSSLSYYIELGAICQGHTESYDWINENLSEKEVRGDHKFNSIFIASILRLADILDIDGNRTPYNLYKLINPKGVGDEEWNQHFIISNNEKIETNSQTDQKYIILHGKSHNPKIHRKLLNYISWIEHELDMSIKTSSTMNEQYILNYENEVRTNIQTEGFTFSDYKMQLDYTAISNLLMGEKIYGSKEYGLREIIQNSYDACILKKEINEKNIKFGEDIDIPKVKVIVSKEENLVFIKDNGIGMNLSVIKNHFLNIGISYYKSTDFKLRDYNYKPIGNYGIGFLACFMLSENVKVKTRHFKSKYKYIIELEKGDEWTSLDKKEDLTFEGTEIELNYEEVELAFNNNDFSSKKEVPLNDKIQSYLTKYFLTDQIELDFINRDEELIIKIKNHLNENEIDLKKDEIKIDLSHYLNGIEGFVILKRSEKFYTSLNDLNNKFLGEAYVYTDDELINLDDTQFMLDAFINNNRIKFLTIPIIDSSLEDKFMSGMEFTEGDITEVLDRLEFESEYVTILFEKELQQELYEGQISEGDTIVRKFGFENLEHLGQSFNCSTQSSLDYFNLYKGTDQNLYMPFDENIYSNSRFPDHKKNELYIRNVLIDNFKFKFTNCASIFTLTRAKINILDQGFVPDISRNNLQDTSSQVLNYLINKVIHVAALENFKLEKLEKVCLKKFIDEHFSEKLVQEKSR